MTRLAGGTLPLRYAWRDELARRGSTGGTGWGVGGAVRVYVGGWARGGALGALAGAQPAWSAVHMTITDALRFE
jgi:hypothetical protein